jgi:hypothetical protein
MFTICSNCHMRYWSLSIPTGPFWFFKVVPFETYWRRCVLDAMQVAIHPLSRGRPRVMAANDLHKRVLLLGPTGVDKHAAIARLNARLKDTLGHQFKYIDFENDYLKPKLNVRHWTVFLAQDIAQQANTWRQAWDELRENLDGENTILGLHATYISKPLGLRCPVQIPSICEDFNPTLIISLIDDVFQMWTRTEDRAAGEELKGRPDFEQLLVARRAETLLGDVILSHTGNSAARHVLCGLHPVPQTPS